MRGEDWTRSPVRIVSACIVLALGAIGLALSAPAGGAASVPVAAVRRTIDVNAATASELRLLPNIGPKRAEAIVRSRERQGPYPTLDALQRVHGIVPRTVRGLREFARVE